MKTRTLVIAVVSLFVTALAYAQKTEINWDRSANFGSYHTYTWEASRNPAKGAWNQRIIDAVDQQLQAKGLTQVNSNPDLWVVYSKSIRDEKQIIGMGYNPGAAWTWNPATYATLVTKVGTLVVELADARNKQLIWRGAVSDTISDNTDKNIKIVDKAVAKLFKEYPPKAKSPTDSR